MTQITPAIQAQAQRVGMCSTCSQRTETGCGVTDTAVAEWLAVVE